MRQTSFSFIQDYKKEFGGTLLIGKRKSKRPLSTKKPIHLVLKSCQKSLFNPSNRSLEKLIKSQCHKFGIRLYDLAINWSHIHCVIRLQRREDYNKFIRSLTSIITQKIRDVKPHLNDIFTLRPFTRILSWGRDFQRALEYQVLNQLESLGLIKRDKKSRKNQKSLVRRDKKTTKHAKAKSAAVNLIETVKDGI